MSCQSAPAFRPCISVPISHPTLTSVSPSELPLTSVS
ncbi:unnamed protein product, partial [Staurois parvus]